MWDQVYKTFLVCNWNFKYDKLVRLTVVIALCYKRDLFVQHNIEVTAEKAKKFDTSIS